MSEEQMTTELDVLQEQLAAALADKDAADQAVAEVMADVEAEFAAFFQHQREAKARVAALEEAARLAIEDYRNRTGEKPEQRGFSVQMRETPRYDAGELLAWAVEHAHALLTLNEKAVKPFLDQCQTAIHPEDGEKVWLHFGHPVPAILASKATAVISKPGLLTWLDEHRYEREQKAVATHDL